MRRRLTFLIGLVLLAPALRAAELFRLEDPKGDDFGAGDLVYPNRPDFQRGSLDLEWLAAVAADGGTWFRARLGRDIPDPHGRVTDIGGQPLETLARNGFYSFNIDIYVDMDRVAGSGRTDTLPGRVVEVRREDAWEKAIILTPRPEVARAWYALHLGQVREAELRAEKGKVERDDVPAIDAEVEQVIRRDFYFADRIRVRGREIEFFVPDEVLGGPAREEWAYTVLVTGSDVEQAGRLLNFSPGGFTLMAMSLAPGHATDRFGIVNRGDINQPPIVDLLARDVETQKRALSDYDVVAPRYAAVPGVSPSGRPAMAASSTAASPAREPSAGTPPTAGAPSEPVAGATGSERPSARRTISSRLKSLNALRDEGLVSEEEYRQLRRKILGEI